MRNKVKFLGFIALVAVMVVFAGCVTNTTVGGTADGLGLINPGRATVTEGATEIASYSVILGLITSGYEEYFTAVSEALAAGRTVTTVTTWLVFLTRTTAYAR